MLCVVFLGCAAAQLSWCVRCLFYVTVTLMDMDPSDVPRRRMPGWLRLGLLCALTYFALGQLRLMFVYPLFSWLPPDTWHPVEIDFAILAVLLVSVVPAFARHPQSARWAAYSAGIGTGGGLALHLLGRWLLWPQLEGGCWIHTIEQGGLPDLVCADIVPMWREEPRFGYMVLGWTLGGMAFAFLLGAVVIAVRHMVGRRAALT